jgi:hypothetical protein
MHLSELTEFVAALGAVLAGAAQLRVAVARRNRRVRDTPTLSDVPVRQP